MNAETTPDASGEVLKARDEDRAIRARENREERLAARQPKADDPLSVTINAPNTVTVNGNQVALNIDESRGTPDEGGGGTVEIVYCAATGPMRADFVVRGTPIPAE